MYAWLGLSDQILQVIKLVDYMVRMQAFVEHSLDFNIFAPLVWGDVRAQNLLSRHLGQGSFLICMHVKESLLELLAKWLKVWE